MWDEEYINNEDWKKMYSQDGSYYYINKYTGQKKTQKSSLSDINTTSSSLKRTESFNKSQSNLTTSPSIQNDSFIQQYNADRIPFFVNMRTGVSYWELPEGVTKSHVKYITHFTENGDVYYEDVEKGTTSWTLPVEKLSASARRSSLALKKMNREQSELFISSVDNGAPPGLESSSPSSSGNSTNKISPVPLRRANSKDISGLKKKSEELTDSDMGSISSRRPFQEDSSPAEDTSIEGGISNSNNSSTNRKSAGKSIRDMRAERASKRMAASSKSIKPQLQTLQAKAPDTSITPIADDENADGGYNIDDVSTSHTPFSRSAAQPSPLTAGAIAAKRSETEKDKTMNGLGPRGQRSNTQVYGDSSKPLVRQVFEQYEKGQRGFLDLHDIQELCYDFGTYLPLEDIHLAMNGLDSNGDGSLQYEEFMVWWRSNERFSTMKVNDEKQKRKNSAVLIFKKYDCDIMGKITRQDFQLMYRDLVRQQFTKSDSDEIIQYLDATGTGFIEFNDYMQWVDEPSRQKNGSQPLQTKQSIFTSMFGALLGSKKNDKGFSNAQMCKARDHPDYAKYFRMISVGGNLFEVAEDMRSKGLDDTLLQTPEKLISAESMFVDTSRSSLIHQSMNSNEESLYDTEMINGNDIVVSEVSVVQERAFKDMFKRKSIPVVQVEEEEDEKDEILDAGNDGFIRVSIKKPLGMVMGENEPDEPKGVHVDNLVSGGNAESTGKLRIGLQVVEIMGQNVENLDFDSIMDILRAANPEIPVEILFYDKDAVRLPTYKPKKSTQKSIVSHDVNDDEKSNDSDENQQKYTKNDTQIAMDIAENNHNNDSNNTHMVSKHDNDDIISSADNSVSSASPSPSTSTGKKTTKSFSARRAAAIQSAKKKHNSEIIPETSAVNHMNKDASDNDDEEDHESVTKSIASDATDNKSRVQQSSTQNNSSKKSVFQLPFGITVDDDDEFKNDHQGVNAVNDLSMHNEEDAYTNRTKTLDTSAISGRATIPSRGTRKKPSLLQRSATDVTDYRARTNLAKSNVTSNTTSINDSTEELVEPLFDTSTKSQRSSQKKHIPSNDTILPHDVYAHSSAVANVTSKKQNTSTNRKSSNSRDTIKRSDSSSVYSNFDPENVIDHPRYSSASSSRSHSPSSLSHHQYHFTPSSTHRPISTFSTTNGSMSVPRQSLSTSSSRAYTYPSVSKTIDTGTQSDYTNIIIDPDYLNSYQMILTEKSEIAAMREEFRKEMMERENMMKNNYESMMHELDYRKSCVLEDLNYQAHEFNQYIATENNMLAQEKNDIALQWENIQRAEAASREMHTRRTSEILDLMHILQAHHEKIHTDKKKIARQRMQLDLALQDLNKFNSFSPDMKRYHNSPNNQGLPRWVSPAGSRVNGRAKSPSNTKRFR